MTYEMSEEESIVYAVWDRIPDNLPIVEDERLLASPHLDFSYERWRNELGHPRAHPGCCKTCGCATSCMLAVFHEAVIVSVIRELLRQGLIVGDFRDGPASTT